MSTSLVHQTQSTSLTTTSSPTLAQIPRTSSLLAPILLLQGHTSEIFSAKFSRDGKYIASGGLDRDILVWETAGECNNFAVLKGHKSAVLEVAWSRDSSLIYSVSADNSLQIHDVASGTRLKKFRDHRGIVNSVSVNHRGSELLVTGSDDGTVRFWDLREKESIKWFETGGVPVTAVCWNKDDGQVFSGGLDNSVHMWDLRTSAISNTLSGHTDTITSLRLSPSGTHLLSSGMDSTSRIWDLRPYIAATGSSSRLVKTLLGAPHGYEKNLIKSCWSPDAAFVASGSADRSVIVWRVEDGNVVYKLPGHKGCVNEVDWHPKEPVLISASSDKTMYLGEINPEEVM